MPTFTWWVPFCAGGLGDRILGLVSTFCIARELKRDFLIKWDQNDLSSVIPINPKYNYYLHPVNTEYIELDSGKVQTFFLNENVEELWKNKPHVMIWCNQNIFHFFCQKRKINYAEKFFSGMNLLFTDFLLPIKEVYDSIPTNLDKMIGIHIRTHDKQIRDQTNTDQIPYVIDILKRCKESIQGKREGNKVFIASDCILVPKLAKEVFGEEYTLCFNDGPIIHSGQEQDKISKEGLIRVMVDLLSLSRCKLLYLGWNTNFSRVGALLNPKRMFYTYEHPNHKGCIHPCDILELMNYFSIGGRW